MKKVLILGAGRGQIPIMQLCHKHDCEVICVSPKGNYPGLKLADKVIESDVKDLPKIMKNLSKMKIDAVLTDQLDSGVLTAACIAEKLGLKGITTEVATKFTNKYIMRCEAKKSGICVPECDISSDLEVLKQKSKKIGFPLMMKPVDSAASRGVYKINNIEELESKFESSKSYSKKGQVIIERFINGREYVIEAYTHNKKVTNLVVGHRDYFNVPETFIPNATIFIDANSADNSIEKRLKLINEKLIESFGLEYGITHGEYLYNEKEDKIYLVEIAARGGGVFISSDLIPMACGVNANELLVKENLGIQIEKEIKLKKGASAYFCYLTPEGEVISIENDDKIINIDGVYKAFFDNIYIGMKTSSIKDKSSRKGPILIKGNSKKECYQTIDEVKKILKIKVLTNSGEKNIIWN